MTITEIANIWLILPLLCPRQTLLLIMLTFSLKLSMLFNSTNQSKVVFGMKHM